MRLRVAVSDVWDIVELSAAPDWTAKRVKEEALAATVGSEADSSAFEVKFRGAKVLDEEKTLEQLAVPNNAALIVLRVRRQPVK